MGPLVYTIFLAFSMGTNTFLRFGPHGFLFFTGTKGRPFALESGWESGGFPTAAGPLLYLQVPVYFTKPAEAEATSRGAAQKAMNARHRCWIRRYKTGGNAVQEPVAWRPKPLKRVASRHWLQAKDNMIRVSTEWEGLGAVVPKYDEEKNAVADWKESAWESWRHLQLCQDRGSDGVCATNCLLYAPEVRANVTIWFDESHDLENDLYGMFRSLGLYPFMMVVCVVMNLGHGCERDRDLRYWQFVDLMKFVFNHFEAANCESFQVRCAEMMQDLGDKVPHDGSAQSSDALWAFEKGRCSKPYLRERVNMVRFFSWPAAGRDLLQEWSSLLWKVELLCVECDWLSSAQFKAKINLRMRQLTEDEEARGSTSSSIPSIDGKIVRQACQNACVIALGILEETSHKRLLALMVAVAEPIMHMRGEHATMCRNSEDTLSWAADLVGGHLMDQCRTILNTLGTTRSNLSLGFRLTLDEPMQAGDPRIDSEDEWAELLGSMVLSLMGRRIKRKLYMFGLPHRHVLLTKNPDEVTNLMQELRLDLGAKESLEHQPDSAAKKTLLDRSLLNTTAVRQCIAGAKAQGWQAALGSAWATVARHSMQGGMSTLMCEEMIGFAKNSKKQRGATVFRKPEVSMAMVLGNDVVTKRFKYTQTDDAAAPPSKRARLLPEAFGRGSKEPTVKFPGLVSTRAKPPWFSPAANHIGVNTADLAIMRYAQETKQFAALGNAHLSCLADAHPFVFKRVVAEPLEDKDIATGWFVGLANYGDSAAIVWPVSLSFIPFYESTDLRIVTFSQDLKRPELLTVLSWKNLKAIPFQWRSPAWFRVNCPLSPAAWHGEIRAVVSLTSEGSMAQIAARQGWWSLDMGQLKKLAQHLGCPLGSDVSMYQAMTRMTTNVLDIEEGEALQYHGARIRAQDDPEGIEEFLDIEEASNLLHKNDEEDFQKEKKKRLKEREGDDSFRREYAEAKKKHRPPQAAAANHGRQAKGRSRGKASAPPARRLPPGDVVDLETAKALKPEGSFVWRAWTHEAWEGRLPPHKVVRRSWRGGSAAVALKLVLRELWTQYLADEGLDRQHCPVEGLFE